MTRVLHITRQRFSLRRHSLALVRAGNMKIVEIVKYKKWQCLSLNLTNKTKSDFHNNLSKYQLKLGTKICVTCSLNIQNLLVDTFLTLSEWYLYNK